MKLFKPLLLLISLTAVAYSCSEDDDDDTTGNWTEIAEPAASVRGGAVSFVLNGKGYFGLGYNGTNSNAKGYKLDFWGFNGSGWNSDIPAFTGTPRERAVAFIVNNKVYVGLGYNVETDIALADFWEYDPATEEWSQIGDFPIPLYNAVAFVVDGRAFVGTGRNNDDEWETRFWEFDAANREWPEVGDSYTSIPGNKREGAFAFVINSTAYIGGGYSNGTYRKQLFAFTPSSDSEMQEITLDDDDDYYDDFSAAVGRTGVVTFVWGGKVYFATGSAGSALSSVYEYDPATQVWDEKTDFEGVARSNAVGFILEDRMFLGTGNNSSTYFSDFWEFKPLEESDDDD
jgi:N-acetylneuraminic acid mutarotase